MADTPQVPDMNAIGSQANNFSTVLSNLSSVVDRLSNVVSKMFGSNAKSGVDNFNSSLGDTINLFDKFGLATEKAKDLDIRFSALTNTAGELLEPIDKISNTFMNLAQFMNTTKFFDNFTKEGTSAINTIDKSGGALAAKLADVLSKISGQKVDLDFAKNLVGNAAQGEKLQNVLIGMAASQGNLNTLFVDGGTQLKNFLPIQEAYIDQIKESGRETGLGADGAMAMSEAMKEIPGLMGQVMDVGDKSNIKISQLTGNMQLMSGSGKGLNEVLAAQKTAYDNLGQATGKVVDNGQKGNELFATTSTLANALGMNFKDVQSVMDQLAGDFRDFGNETDQVAQTLNRFTGALQETGLTAKESLGITAGLIKNIGDMNTAQKAFLSARSGGPGGLQGAAQIDMLLRAGKEDQVMKMAQQSLMKQFGGKITTEQEAATMGGSAAIQNQKQMQMIQSGIFGIGKGTTDQQAQHILEAMKKGDMGGAVKVGKDAVKDVSEKGISVQQSTNSTMKDLYTLWQTSQMYIQLGALATVKLATGTGSEELDNIMKEASLKSHDAQEKDKVNRTIGGGFNPENNLKPGMAAAGIEATTAGSNAYKQIVKSVGSHMKEINKAIGDAVDGFGGLGNQINEDIAIKRGNKPMPIMDHKSAMATAAMKEAGHHPLAHKESMAAHTLGAHAAMKGGGEAETAKVSIEVLAAPGLNVKVKSNSKTVNVIQQHNVAALRGHPSDNDPGY
jgi:hypothetical protein